MMRITSFLEYEPFIQKDQKVYFIDQDAKLMSLDLGDLKVDLIDTEVKSLAAGNWSEDLYYIKVDDEGRAEIYKDGVKRFKSKSASGEIVFTAFAQCNRHIVLAGFDCSRPDRWEAVFECMNTLGKTIAIVRLELKESYDEIPQAIRVIPKSSSLSLILNVRCSSFIDLLIANKSKMLHVKTIEVDTDQFNNGLAVIKTKERKREIYLANDLNIYKVELRL